MHKISAALIVHNEEKHIVRTLEKLQWCDEIVVVDSYSSDSTVDLCKAYNAKVFYKKFEGYGSQKRFMVSKCCNDWILSVDADEVLTDALIDEVRAIFSKDKINHAGFYIPRRHVFLGKIFRYGGESRKYFLRIFDKSNGNFTKQSVHEQVLVKGDTAKLKNILLHYTADTIGEYSEKIKDYAALRAEEYFRRGKTISVTELLIKLPFVFFKEYIFDLNFLNGFEGFVWSFFVTQECMLKYMLLREKRKQTGK